jgi:predicted DsbA family dithiol-disulfide isomerase
LDYAFDKIQLRANTLMAHRLLYWAQQRGEVDTLVERLFAAQFQRGEMLGDLKTLVSIGEECGLPSVEVAAYLASDTDAVVVRDKEQSYRQRGISMVPSFILQDEMIIVGAEDPNILANAIIQLL